MLVCDPLLDFHCQVFRKKELSIQKRKDRKKKLILDCRKQPCEHTIEQLGI